MTDSNQDSPEQATVVRGIISEQFDEETSYKEEELEKIEDRIRLAKMMLQRLRLGVLAQHYGVAGFYPTALDYSKENVGAQESWDVFEKEFLSRQSSCSEGEQATAGVKVEGGELIPAGDKVEAVGGDGKTAEEGEATSVDRFLDSSMETSVVEHTQNIDSEDLQSGSKDSTHTTPTTHSDISRFYTKKRIIIGNTSQFLSPSVQQSGDGSTHKWMVYIRGPQDEPDISHFVKAVRFFLHPSYHPNDIVRVTSRPFHLTRLGWGEFPIRIQLEFCDRTNKPIDIIHNLVLDRTHTGQQTLGAETVVDLDISIKGKGRGLTAPPNGLRVQLMKRNENHKLQNKTSDGRHGDMLLEELPCPPVSHSVSPLLSDTPSSTKIVPPNQHSEHNYCTAVVVKGGSNSSPSIGGHSSHPHNSTTTKSLVLTTNLDKCLHNAVRAIPLCGHPSEDFMLSASSFGQLMKWSVGRRRAAEWMRAVAVRRQVERKLRLGSLLTTKQVMQWCRRNGYTWLDQTPPTGRGFCKYCGCQLDAGEESEGCVSDMDTSGGGRCVHENCGLEFRGIPSEDDDSSEEEEEMRVAREEPLKVKRKLSTLSECFGLVTELVELRERLEREERARVEDCEVDVESLPECSSARSREYGNHTPRFRIPQTPELKWVQQTAGGLGINIYPAVIDRMYAHVVEHMIFMSCTKFLRAILTQAVRGSGAKLQGDLHQERILTPLHIHQAVHNLQQCDFLTNRYLGVCPSQTLSDDSESEDE